MAAWPGPLEAVVNNGFWTGRSVFLTGHTGFKGSWLSLMLARLGAHVTGFSDAVPTTPSLYEAADVASGLTEIRGDIADRAAVVAAMRASAPDVVIHMAAQPLVRLSYADPILTYTSNVMGTAHVLEAARVCPSVSVIVVVTTDKCYANHEWPWGYREIDALGGHDPYSASKSCAEMVTASYRASFFAKPERRVAVATARAGNVVGGGDFALDRVLPDAFRAFSAGMALQLRNPKAVRPWQHVLDPLWGYLLLAERAAGDPERYSEAWNFGPGSENEQPVDRLVVGFIERWGKDRGTDARWEQQPGKHPQETHLLRLDASKGRQQLGWRPHLGFEAMLDWTADWYRAFADGSDVRSLTLRQICDYLAAVT